MPDESPPPCLRSRFRVPQYWLALLLTLGEFALIYLMAVVGVPPDNEKIAFLLAGAYTAEWASMLKFFSGTTQGSTEKTSVIARAQPVAPDS